MTRYAVVGLAALLLTLTAYRSVWTAGWVYEDRATLTAAQDGTGWQRAVTSWTWRLTPTPRRAHAVSLGLHISLALLLGVVAWRLGLTPFGAWIVGLLWLLHPMAVETAAYAKSRSDQIVLLGVLVALVGASGAWWRPLGLLAVVGGSALAIGGEQSGVVVLLLVPLVIWSRRARAWWGPVAGAAALIVAGVLWYGGPLAVINADGEAGLASAEWVTWHQWLLAQSGAVWYWLIASVWPAFLTPDVDVDRLSMLTRWCGLGVMVASAGLAWRLQARQPLVALGLLLALCAVLPRLIVQTPRSYLNAAQFALPFMGLALLAGYGTERVKAAWNS